MSVASRAAEATSIQATVDVAAAPGRDGSGAASASLVARDQLIETIGKNVMAWTKWNVPDDVDAQIQSTTEGTPNAKRG